MKRPTWSLTSRSCFEPLSCKHHTPTIELRLYIVLNNNTHYFYLFFNLLTDTTPEHINSIYPTSPITFNIATLNRRDRQEKNITLVRHLTTSLMQFASIEFANWQLYKSRPRFMGWVLGDGGGTRNCTLRLARSRFRAVNLNTSPGMHPSPLWR